MSETREASPDDPVAESEDRAFAHAICPGCMKRVPPGLGYCPLCGLALGTRSLPGADDEPQSVDYGATADGEVDPDGACRRPVGLGAVVAVWVIFAPTAIFGAYAFAMWARHVSGTLQSMYAVFGAAFCAVVFGAPVVGMTQRYFSRRKLRR